MDLNLFMQSGAFNWVIMPLLIFLARIIDMTLGTIRIIFVARGQKYLAPIIGFFEVFIWLLVVRQIITSMDNFLWMIAYAAGFAMGTYLGLVISERLSVSNVLFRIIVKKFKPKLVKELREKGHGVTVVNAADKKNPSKIIYTLVHTSDINEVAEIIEQYNPRAFYSVEDIRRVSEGVFPHKSNLISLGGHNGRRKGK